LRTVAQFSDRVVGRAITEVRTAVDNGMVYVYGLVLDDGTVVLADGGEDVQGGYGFLCFEDDE